MVIDNKISAHTITKQRTSPLLQSILTAHIHSYTQGSGAKSEKIKPENDIFKTKVKKLSNSPYQSIIQLG